MDEMPSNYNEMVDVVFCHATTTAKANMYYQSSANLQDSWVFWQTWVALGIGF